MSAPIVVLTGAGISAESGLSTFRDAGGIWSQVRLEDVATPEGFAADPVRVLEFYNARRQALPGVEPNAAHIALAELERKTNALIVTQNVDNLHERGGATQVVHMHGELMRATCHSCRHTWDAPEDMQVEDPCPACGKAATRPDVVWFGEMPYHMDAIHAALEQAKIFVAIGTSAQVYPAAGFVSIARAAGAHCVEINLKPTDMSGVFHERIEGPASETVPKWVTNVLA